MLCCTLLIILLSIPFASIQHFIWPLHWCLLADICNHTWIPECGQEDEQENTRRLFIDECDMFEYNCDYEKGYKIVNYSLCSQPTTCPPVQPCSSHAPSPNHNYHRMGHKYISPAREFIHSHLRRPKNIPSLPKYMLKRNRRYTPMLLTKRKHTTTTYNLRESITNPMITTLSTLILKKETVIQHGRKFVKIVKRIVRKKDGIVKGSHTDKFLEK